MDIQILGTILSLLFLYVALRITAHTKKKITSTKTTVTTKLVPQPSGAWPFIGHLPLLRGKDPVALTLGAMADDHGPIFSLKLGQHQVLVLSAWDTVKECLTTNDRVFATRPSIAGGKYLGYDNALFSLAPYGPYWRHIRKLATLELLSTKRVETLSHVRTSEVDLFIKNLLSLCTKNGTGSTPVHLSELIEFLTFNINVRLIAGKRFTAEQYNEKNSEAWRFEKAVKEALYLFGVFVWSDAMPWLEWLDSLFGHVGSMKRCFKELDCVLGKWLEEHRQRSRPQGKIDRVESDLMDVMISSLQEEEDVISGHSLDNVIKSTALVLILTGTESTSVTLTWALSLLLNNPKTLKAAQQELDIHVGRDRWVQESDLPNLKYLQAILKETLRVYPPGPLTGLREATEDCHLAGYHVPKGTRVLVNIWKLQRDPSMWGNPSEFQPERFMTTHADVEFKGQNNFEYIPFSSGRRSCPGMVLGLQVVQLILARLVQGFDMSRVGEEAVDMREGLGLALPKANPLEALLSPRLPLHLYK
ncbi:PREDICTED: cytochrome P450 [Prunus dulcis]|uniref:PREDICTED: cytochrome P450 n=1 Tax=Prunus dulcis TaxID=3755 RepID=A0A5E4EK58_PRUDU|nr:dimethylnonatriene synthase-like [Prunus dulcis]VVA15772.1 PREDICTED: cytochrome P450 [Prunus dulcis]